MQGAFFTLQEEVEGTVGDGLRNDVEDEAEEERELEPTPALEVRFDPSLVSEAPRDSPLPSRRLASHLPLSQWHKSPLANARFASLLWTLALHIRPQAGS